MQRAAQNLITEKAVVYEADSMGLGVSNDELRDYLHQGEFGQILFPNGNFIGQLAYEQFIENQFNMGVQEFEQEVKAEIAQHKLLAAVGAAVTVSDKDITQQVKQQNTKVKFDYAVLTLDDVKKQINPNDAELKAFYQQNQQQYVNSIPEKIKAKYILIDTSKMADKIDITPVALEQYYKEHQDDYRVPESATVRHILITTPAPDAQGKVDQQGVDAAQAKAEDILKQLKAGANFADLAKKYSQDPGSAEKGGLLPPITRGRTVAAFENAAFNTPVGQTTGIIRTNYGFHIIHVEAKQQARLRPLSEVKPEIEAMLKKQQAGTEAQRLANTVQSLARTSGMEKAAAEKGLSVTSTDLVSQDDQLPGVGAAPDFMTTLFGAKKDEPPAVASTPQGFAVYQVTQIQPPQTPSFEQIKAKVAEQFRDQQAQMLLRQKTQEVGATIKTSDLVGHDSQLPELGAMSGPASVAFSLKAGEISGPIQSGPDGAVLKILEVQEPSPEEVKQGWETARESLLQQKRQEYEGLYVQNLRDTLEKQGKIKINKEEMKRLTAQSEGS
jgi:peptidyl-prolyl cis-trans isomerase D